MATHAEIANDMAAQARYWQGRDLLVERACRDAAHMLRSFIEGKRVDGRTYGGLCRRLLNLELSKRHKQPDLSFKLDRARLALEALNCRARADG
ncbi:MAG: hypothetical protein ACU0A5_06490 [Salipiger marinus]|uniref:hypothetical protein n=1 Tax=Salipiger marinus TaxID=555512 RepID=UPI00405A2F60